MAFEGFVTEAPRFAQLGVMALLTCLSCLTLRTKWTGKQEVIKVSKTKIVDISVVVIVSFIQFYVAQLTVVK